MDATIRGVRFRDSRQELPMAAGHESEPFLGTPDAEADIELQAVNRENDHQGPGHHRTNQTTEFGDDYAHHGFYPAQTGLSTLLDALVNRVYVLRWAFRRLRKAPNTIRPLHIPDEEYGTRQPKKKRPRSVVVFTRTIGVVIMLLGILQLVTIILGVLTAFAPEKLDFAFKSWTNRENLDGLYRWPTDYTADIVPARCHSHNDYWRRVPLLSAIKAGCTGVEADVWLNEDDLLVGHEPSALKRDRTLISLYINPLVEILDRQNPTTVFQTMSATSKNGVFDTNPPQTLVLLIDFKTNGLELFPVVQAQLEPLRRRNYLTHFKDGIVVEGPITVVATGNAPFDQVVANMTYRDIFFDAPLDQLAVLANKTPSLVYNSSTERQYLAAVHNTSEAGHDHQNQDQGQGRSGLPPSDPSIFQLANSYYASTNFKAAIGWPRPYLSQTQKEKIAAQIAGAHAQGLKVRYWNVPSWPVGLRNYLWRELAKLGVDYINADDIQGVTKGDWRSGHSVFDWSLWGGRDW